MVAVPVRVNVVKVFTPEIVCAVPVNITVLNVCQVVIKLLAPDIVIVEVPALSVKAVEVWLNVQVEVIAELHRLRTAATVQAIVQPAEVTALFPVVNVPDVSVNDPVLILNASCKVYVPPGVLNVNDLPHVFVLVVIV